ncbi:MAG: sugar kinase [Anaerolineae bacterium]
MSQPVIVLGDANVDLVIHLPDYHHGDRDLTKSVPQLFGGGTGANTAVALARLGVPTIFMGTIGDDGFGRWIQADFAREGVDTRGLTVLHDAFTPQVIAMIQPDGERHLVIFPPEGGAHTHMESAHLNVDLLRSAAWVHTTGMCLRASPVRESILEGLRIAHEAGVRTSLDLNLRVELWGYDEPMRRTTEAAIALADVVLGSGDEEMIPITGAATVEEAARQLANGQRTVVARLGSAGALAVDRMGIVYRKAALPVTVKDTLGAGDAFNAGYIAALLGYGEGRTGELGGLTMGAQVAAYKIAHGGARATPHPKALREFLAEAPISDDDETHRRRRPRYCEG